jgi:hypothetical protein
MTASTLARRPADRGAHALPTAYWLLRAGAALCFIGHGAFGFITKAAWVPYFAVVGIPEAWAWRLMPMVGAVDVMAGMAVLYAPRALPLVYMAVWATWTALLRPFAGEPVWEAFERAGNYGVPLALLALTGWPRSLGGLWRDAGHAVRDDDAGRGAQVILQCSTVLLLIGHGALGALTVKPQLTAHWASIALPSTTTVLAGWLEIALALAIALRAWPALLIVAAMWKLATESLWLVSGAPVWEFVERAGSYAAPLALAALVVARTRSRSRREQGG